MINKTVCYFLFIILQAGLVSGQHDSFRYKREIKGVNSLWHSIEIEKELFEKINSNFSDIRIIGFTNNGDTIEAPYLIKAHSDSYTVKEFPFNLLNKSRNEKGFYYTFELDEPVSLNEIQLTLDKTEFDWRVNLEGSQNMNEWYTIIQDYRIISIQNDLLNYSFTKLVFPESKYKYFRVLVKDSDQPSLTSARLLKEVYSQGRYKEYEVRKIQTHENSKEKTTEIIVDLLHAVPVSRIKLNIKNDIDYYRPISITYINDSIQTKDGWRYQHRDLTHSVLSSFESPVYKVSNTITSKIRVLIYNHDNRPLDLNGLQISGEMHEIIGRFDEDAEWSLYYGKDNSPSPKYDLVNFKSSIPETLDFLSIGEEKEIKELEEKPRALFENSIWLWSLMLLIIVILGWFSFSMMKKREE